MKEAVRQIKNGWVVPVVIAGFGVAYFTLLGTSKFDEPGPNIEYNTKDFEDLDNIETRFEEKDAIDPKLDDPRAVAAAGGKLFVAATDTVAVLDKAGKELARYKVSGTPSCITVADDGTIYVGMRTKVAVLDQAGVSKGEWTDFTPRSFITAIAVHKDDVYVADAGKRVVCRFDRSGKLQTRIGEKDAAKDIPGLEAPSPYLDLAINGDGDLWVVNPGKLGLEQYRPDGSLVTSWYRPTVLQLDGFPGCCNPTHIAFDSKGNLFTCEKGLVRLKEYEVTAGSFEGLVASSKTFPQEQSMRDLAVDDQDRLLVVDGKRKAIRVFARKEVKNGPAIQSN